jgi:hypothetical protein
MMVQAPVEFLPSVIAVLQQLQEESAERNESMLAFLLDLAKTEAEDRLRQAGLDDDLRSTLKATSTIGFLSRARETPPAAPPPSRRRKGKVNGGRGDGARGPHHTA